MASTTNAKKEIIDFLWEWADAHGTWGKLLVDTIVKTEAGLSDQERELVFDYFIDSLRKAQTLPAITIVKPVFASTSKTISLTSLSNISGVNRLAKNQKMEFSSNITVIYGENGTGKTGYSRILKSIGFSYDMQNTIHNNIFAKAEPKTADIDFIVNTVPESFTWTGINSHAALSNISVFNSNCVQISLADRKLIVSPIGFHLFGIVTDELLELAKLLQTKINSYPVILLWAASLNEGTLQHTFISALSEKSTEQRLNELAAVTPDIDAKIEQKEKDLAGLNRELLSTQILNLNNQISELNAIITKIESAQTTFTDTEWQALITLNGEISTLEGKTKVGLKDVAELNGIAFYEKEEFKDFIVSAEKYINLLDKPYPETGDVCVYCNQPLEDSAQKLLQAYRNLLNDTTASDLKKLLNDRTAMADQVKLLDANLMLNHGSFGLDNESKVIQPAELTAYNASLKELKELFCTNTLTKEKLFDLDYAALIAFLKAKVVELQDLLDTKTDALATISQKAATLQSEINELKDRKVLAANLSEIKTVITNKKTIHLLNSKSNEFSTNSISRKTSEARDELISQNFNDLFQGELKAFRKSHLKIDLSFGTDRGNSKITQKINRYLLTDILSEGEQKAIALAEFLTELQLDYTKAPVVFDDPVNSLDHKIIDEVSKRLIELSKTRQVIVFTHNILLLYSFIQQSDLETNKQAGIDCKFHSVKNNFDDTGILDSVEEINSYSYYMAKLNKVLQCLDKSLSEEQMAAEGYGHLRSAIEICVEEEVLQRTIKRYRKGVAFPSLLRIEGAKIDMFKGNLNDIYEKCCVSIAGHSSPSEMPSTPTITDLKADFELFKQLRTNFIKKN